MYFQPFHPDDPHWLRIDFDRVQRKLKTHPLLSSELAQTVREKGRMPAWISDFLKKGPCTEEQRTLSDKLDNIGEKEDKDDDDENSVRAQPTRSSSSQGPILPHNYHSDGESIADLGKKGRRYNSKREEKQLVKKLFQNINRTRRCVCLVGNCKAELDISNKRAHLRAIHKMLPPLQCNFCPFGTYSRTIFRRHDCQNTTKRF